MITQLVEYHPSKVNVTGSNPVRKNKLKTQRPSRLMIESGLSPGPQGNQELRNSQGGVV